MIFSVISSVLIIISIVCLFGLTPEQVTDDLMRLITPNDTMRYRSRNLRGNKKKHRLYRTLVKMKTALAVTGKSKQFTIVCCASLVLFAAGIILSVLIDNIFLMPVLSVAFALIPFFYTTSTLSYYEKNTKEELETALSIITTSYVRSDDIVAAVRENIKYIKPPLRDVFKSFEGEATAISSNIKRALYKLKSMVDNEIFWEWCDTLIQCQDDRTLKDTLLPIVAKLTDVRIVNSELKTMLSSARNEYWFMVALVVGNINIPVDELRERIGELDRSKPVYVICQSGLRSYIASRILMGNGFDAYNFAGGFRFYDAVRNDKALNKKSTLCGMDD